MLVSDVPLPKWLEDGMSAIIAAPSAINRQPVTCIYRNGILTASVPEKMESDLIDLGIAKMNFEISSQIGTFEVGNGKSFVII